MFNVLIQHRVRILMCASLVSCACGSGHGAEQDEPSAEANDDEAPVVAPQDELPGAAEPQVVVQTEEEGSYITPAGAVTDITSEGNSRSHVKFGDLLDVWARPAFTWRVFELDGAVRSEIRYNFVDESNEIRREFGLRVYYVPDDPSIANVDLAVSDPARDRAVGWTDGEEGWIAGSGSMSVMSSNSSNGGVPVELTVTISDLVMIDSTGASSRTLSVGNSSVVGEVTAECIVRVERDSQGIEGSDGASVAGFDERVDVAWSSEFCQRAKAELDL